MRVRGQVLAEKDERDLLDWMKIGSFQTKALDARVRFMGYAPLFADRLIQRERIAGNLRQVKLGMWVWVGAK